MSDFKRAAEALSDAREIVVCWRRLKTDPMGQFSVSGNRLSSLAACPAPQAVQRR